MVLRTSLVLALTACLGGCATTSGYEAVLQTWVGDSTDHLVAVWGGPAQEWDTSDGGHIYQYVRGSSIVIPGATTYKPIATTYTNGTISGSNSNGGMANSSYNGTSTTYIQETAPPTVIQTSCVTRFTIDSSGTINSWNYEGNDCVAIAPKKEKQTAYHPATTAGSIKARCIAARNLCEEGNKDCPEFKKDFDAEGLACPGVNRPPYHPHN